MDLTASNQGYYLVAADGGIFTYGDAVFLGSRGGAPLNKPIVGMRVTPNSPVTAPDFTVDLRGSKEVPGPGDADGNGFGLFDFTDDEICFNLKVNSIGTATAAHIHEAPAGQAGPVLVTLKAPDANGTSTACTDVDKAIIADILDDPQNYYVNIHNAEFPGGAVRGQLQGETGVAITEAGDAIVFDTENPEFTTTLFKLPASIPAAAVVGADFRPATDEAYLLLQLSGTMVQVVKAKADGTGEPVGGPITLTSAASAFGFDFNPVPDRIRVITNAGENFRVHPDTGAKTQDDPLSNPALGLVGAAYTNNRTPAPANTTLYDIGVSGANDVLVRQGDVGGAPGSPNAGVVTIIGPTGFDSGTKLSFDIAPSLAAEPNNAGAFAVFQPTGATATNGTEIWALNLERTDFNNVPGKASKIGVVGDGTVKVLAFSIF
ncbi:MAG: DUF4394 domain-containing protein [Actinomycetota bacterium]|nr:DUF4394 domain-containing protein [Actinomycetota bacterium]